MAGNTFGTQFRITTWGESHGPGLGVIIDGCPAGLELSNEIVQTQLDRRRPGVGRVTTTRKEADRGVIESGVFEGVTTGTPIHISIRNTNTDSSAYEPIKDTFRPGHADYAYTMKYGHRDWRGGGRASARETAARVAAGAVARAVLKASGVDVFAHTVRIGPVAAGTFDRAQIENNEARCADSAAAEKMVDAILAARKDGDSLGGVVEVIATGVPPGLGEPVYNRLDADLAAALMSINAVKGVEIGAGFSAAAMRGSENNDQMRIVDGATAFLSNNSGGIDGGVSNGNRVVARIAVKPTPSILKTQKTIDRHGNEVDIKVEGRHDPCVCPRAVPVAEAMMCVTLADHLLRNRSARI